MPTWSDGFVTVNSLVVHYYRTGGARPPVVLNHGAGDDGLCWARVAKELERDYDVIMVDARGHGKSGSGRKDYSTAQRVADLAGLLQALQLDRPIVGGHSMGADTSLHLAAEHPEMVRGIFLEDPPIILPGEQVGPPGRAMKLEDMGRMMRLFMFTFKLLPHFVGVRLARKSSPTYPDDEINPWVDSKRRVSFDFLNNMTVQMLNTSAPFEAFRKATVPILLFIGDTEKMSIVSQAAAQEAARANSRVQVVHLEGASHDIRRSRFDGYIPALRKFLGEVYAS
jgi:N-formylmaleamate deformylase